MKGILLTGASGFLGSKIIEEIGINNIITLGRSSTSNIVCDIFKKIPQLPKVDLIIHCAGKAHIVPRTVAEKEQFFNINVIGTRNLLLAIEKNNTFPKYFVFISSVAVYGVDQGEMINENNALKATDPYGLSKIEAEKLVIEWCTINNIICNVLRLPLLAGENPPGNLGTMIKGIKRGYYFNVASGRARRSMVLAQDVAKIIPSLTAKSGIYNLTDGYHPSFSELSHVIAKQLGKNKPINLPFWLANIIAKIGDWLGAIAPLNSNKLKKITANLTFDDSFARKELDWKPTFVIKGLKIKAD